MPGAPFSREMYPTLSADDDPYNGLPEQSLCDADPQTKTLANGCHSSQRETLPMSTVYGYLNEKTILITQSSKDQSGERTNSISLLVKGED